MASEHNPSRRYTDEEVRKLLKRASELERQGTTLPAPVEGPTLVDLEAIAEEAGIPPEAIRQAARELESPSLAGPSSPTFSSAFLGGPVAVELERTVLGEISDSVLESLIPHIQRVADGVGQPSLLGRTLSWQSTNPQSARIFHLTVSVGRGETRLVLEERYGNLAWGLHGGLIGGIGGGVGVSVGMGVGLGALGSVLFATVFPAAIIGGSYALARSIFGSFVRRRARALNRLMDELAGVVEDGVETEPPRLEADP